MAEARDVRCSSNVSSPAFRASMFLCGAHGEVKSLKLLMEEVQACPRSCVPLYLVAEALDVR